MYICQTDLEVSAICLRNKKEEKEEETKIVHNIIDSYVRNVCRDILL